MKNIVFNIKQKIYVVEQNLYIHKWKKMFFQKRVCVYLYASYISTLCKIAAVQQPPKRISQNHRNQ